MQVINAQNSLIARLFQERNQLQEEVSRNATRSGSSSGSVDNSQPFQVVRYHQMPHPEQSGSGSPIEASGEDNWGSRKAKEGKNFVITHSRPIEFMEDEEISPDYSQ